MFLDYCFGANDVKTAIKLVHFANTFHVIDTILPSNLPDHSAACASSLITADAETSQPVSKDEVEVISKIEEVSDSVIPTSSEPSEPAKRFLQQESSLRNHVIWRSEGFWDAALMEGLAAELDFREPVVWDELGADELREAVVGNSHFQNLFRQPNPRIFNAGIHNIVFGQLGTLAFTMHAVGLSQNEVSSFLMYPLPPLNSFTGS